ncbi:hypothetical protein B0H13DRAFT_1854962 [Mycena leptocephala]|nr:hypothetical protein B0H13DRAFT_1854962 [Mycena leptocephala]
MDNIQALLTPHVSAQRQPGSCGLPSRRREGQAMGIMEMKTLTESVRGHEPVDQLGRLEKVGSRFEVLRKYERKYESRCLENLMEALARLETIYIGEVHKGIRTLKTKAVQMFHDAGPLQDSHDSNCAAERRWRWGRPSLGDNK